VAQQRAGAYKIETDDLEEHYRNRSMLKRNVFPEDIAEAIYFLASDLSAKSTGNIINVDAGNAQSFTRTRKRGCNGEGTAAFGRSDRKPQRGARGSAARRI
jgi:hypothetical protein